MQRGDGSFDALEADDLLLDAVFIDAKLFGLRPGTNWPVFSSSTPTSTLTSGTSTCREKLVSSVRVLDLGLGGARAAACRRARLSSWATRWRRCRLPGPPASGAVWSRAAGQAAATEAGTASGIASAAKVRWQNAASTKQKQQPYYAWTWRRKGADRCHDNLCAQNSIRETTAAGASQKRHDEQLVRCVQNSAFMGTEGQIGFAENQCRRLYSYRRETTPEGNRVSAWQRWESRWERQCRVAPSVLRTHRNCVPGRRRPPAGSSR